MHDVRKLELESQKVRKRARDRDCVYANLEYMRLFVLKKKNMEREREQAKAMNRKSARIREQALKKSEKKE